MTDVSEFSPTDPIIEEKFTLPNHAAHLVQRWLELDCTPDPLYPTSRVFSIYYDSANWSLLDAKRNSDFYKTKVRVRWYGDIESGEPRGDSFLEVKTKSGAVRRKWREPTEWPARWLADVRLDAPELRAVNDRLRRMGIVREHLEPALVVEYKRRRFVDPAASVRVCLDYDIACRRAHPLRLPARPVALPRAVFERKGSRVRAAGVHMLRMLHCRKESFSKYFACYERVAGEAIGR